MWVSDMTSFTITYATSNYSSDRRTVTVVAPSVLQAVKFVSQRKFTGSSGRVTEVTEVNTSVHIAR